MKKEWDLLSKASLALYQRGVEICAKQGIILVDTKYEFGKDENGMRELRSIVGKRSHQRTWYRIAKDMQEASELITKNKLRDWVTQIDKKLDEFKPYKHKKLSTV